MRTPASHHVSERGSISILVAFLIPVMCLMVVLVASIGQLVYAKIRLQVTANTCALAAASVQAAGLNEIADLNYYYNMELQKLKKIMTEGKPWNEEKEAIACSDFYKEVLQNILKYQKGANQYFGKYSKLKPFVEKIKRINLPQSELKLRQFDPGIPDGEIAAFKPRIKRRINYRYYKADCDSCSKNAFFWEPKPNDRRTYGPTPDRVKSRSVNRKKKDHGYFEVHEPLEKSRRPTTGVTVELALNIAGLVLGSSFLDAAISGSPTITARAFAKPTGGDISRYEPYYRPVLISPPPKRVN